MLFRVTARGLRVVGLVACITGACATGTTDTPDSGGTPPTDAATATDNGDPESPADDLGPDDTGDPTVDASMDDTGAMDDLPDATVDDTGITPPMDTGSTVTACAVAGGRCVAVTPGACPAPGTVDGTYSCAGGVGVTCCLPGDAGTPADVHVDARVDTGPVTSAGAPVCASRGGTQGWYSPAGMLLCANACAAATAPRCQRAGTTAQGWYSSSGHGCPPYATLIVHDPTCM